MQANLTLDTSRAQDTQDNMISPRRPSGVSPTSNSMNAAQQIIGTAAITESPISSPTAGDRTDRLWESSPFRQALGNSSGEPRGAADPHDDQEDTSTMPAKVRGEISLDAVRSLYGSNAGFSGLRRSNSSVIYPGGPPEFPPVKKLNPLNKKRILVSGGAGFVGSHLVDRLMLMGHDVIAIDNYFTGSKTNLAHWFGHPNFEMIRLAIPLQPFSTTYSSLQLPPLNRHDVVDPIMLEVDQIYHLACPASPVHYQSNPVKTLKTGFFGTYNMLGLAKRVKARFLLTSTSEVYGDPEEHPQTESYWGHVNCIGPRACYDEGKRVAEALTYSYARQDNVDVRVARIFNTFGPRMNWNDGRVVSNFIVQALKGDDITIYGDGSATRSFQYVHDLVDGLIALMDSDFTDPVNLGNPEEYTIKQFADMIVELVNEHRQRCGDSGNTSKVTYLPAVADDPQKRKPDTTRAKEVLGWSPQWAAVDGLRETVAYFHRTMQQ
ncbi:ADP-L-glycero-D-manno-heptose-6-epimerase [Drechslerella dactyloides]|uniref:UDP-glucuronate decarboxylase n=1 Tax=Drechslerella dactyloides TaxID=74499 RepID=A0AAD6J2C9_DREDA|nr:ADP-L-glycero-D-manno-heptose-6-epimerase [Drechslerella dactyloides]